MFILLWVCVIISNFSTAMRTYFFPDTFRFNCCKSNKGFKTWGHSVYNVWHSGNIITVSIFPVFSRIFPAFTLWHMHPQSFLSRAHSLAKSFPLNLGPAGLAYPLPVVTWRREAKNQGWDRPIPDFYLQSVQCFTIAVHGQRKKQTRRPRRGSELTCYSAQIWVAS